MKKFCQNRVHQIEFDIQKRLKNSTINLPKQIHCKQEHWLVVHISRTITGDITQIDLPPKTESGLIQVEKILKNVEGVGFIYFKKSR